MRQIKNFIKVTAPLLVAADAVSFVLASTVDFQKDSWAADMLWFHRELFGHSISLLVYMTYFSYRFRVCKYTWLSITALVLINILNILHYFISLDYYLFYAVILTGYGVLMLALYAVNRSNATRKKLRGR